MTVWLYVDDVVTLFINHKLDRDLEFYSLIQTPHDVSALGQQCNLDAPAMWSNEWQLTISNNKSSVLCLGHSNVAQSYRINESGISLVHEMRDLGVINLLIAN